MQNSMSGAKGGSSSFTQKPDTLRSNDTFEGLLGLCVGPIKGPVRGLKSVRINGTPVEGEDGTLNFPGFTALFADGDPLLFPQKAELQLGAGGSPDQVGANIRNDAAAGGNPWVTHTLNNLGANAIDLRFIVQSLYRQTSRGIFEDQLRLEVQMKPIGTTTWINPFGVNGNTLPAYSETGYRREGLRTLVPREIYDENVERVSNPSSSYQYLVIRGKTTSPYVHELRVQVPNTGVYANKGWDVRVRLLDRESFDSPEGTEEKNRIVERRLVQWESMTAVYSGALGDHEDWRGLSWLQLYGKASDNFTGLPDVDGDYETKIVRVPPATVYDPIARLYTGTIWDGSWAKAFTRDPAWIISDAISDQLAGIAAFVPGASLNKWDALELSKWASELVPDGRGGMHPRYSMDIYVDQPQKADEFIQYLAGAVGAVAWDNGDGEWRLKVDKPEAPVNIFTHENIEGEFLYSHTDVDTRFNDVTVVFLNEEFDYREDRVRIQDFPDIERNGRKPTRVVAIGCTNRQQAIRLAVLRLRTNINEKRMVTFRTNRQARYLERFDQILIADGSLDHEHNTTGRVIVKQADGLAIAVRDPVRLELGAAYELHFTVPNPAYEPEPVSEPMDPTWNQPSLVIKRVVTNTAAQRGDVTTLYLDQAIPSDMPENAVVALAAAGLPALPKVYRVVEVGYDEGESVTVNAVEVDTGKWAAADNADETALSIVPPALEVPSPTAPQTGMFDVRQYTAEREYRRYLSVNWQRPATLFLDNYRLEYQFNDGPWIPLGTTRDTFYELVEPSEGTYKFRVFAQDRRGRSSQPLEGTYLVDGTLNVLPVAELTNPAVTVAATQDGTVTSFAGAGGQFVVRNSIGIVPSGVVYSVVSTTGGLGITIEPDTGHYTVTGLDADFGAATLRAVYAERTIELVYTIAKARNGATGPTLSIVPNASAFTYVDGVLSPAEQTISMSATFEGVAVDVAWATFPNIKSAASGSTFSISAAEMAGHRQLVVTAIRDGVVAAITLTNQADPRSTYGAPSGSPVGGTTADALVSLVNTHDNTLGFQAQQLSEIVVNVDDLVETYGSVASAAESALLASDAQQAAANILSTVNERLVDANEAVDNARAEVENAERHATSAEGYAAASRDERVLAESARDASQGHASTAFGYVEDSQRAASSAEGYAAAARDERIEAQAARENASDFADAAQGFSQTASARADDAEQAAQTANQERGVAVAASETATIQAGFAENRAADALAYRDQAQGHAAAASGSAVTASAAAQTATVTGWDGHASTASGLAVWKQGAGAESQSVENLPGVDLTTAWDEGTFLIVDDNKSVDVFGARAFPIDPSRTYRMRMRVGAYNSAAPNEKSMLYAGFVGVDQNRDVVDHGAFGSYRYCLAQGRLLSHGELITLEAEVTGSGNDSWTKFPPTATQIVPVALLNYRGQSDGAGGYKNGNTSTYVKFITFEDITGVAQSRGYATAAQNSSAQATTSAASAQSSATLAASVASSALTRNPIFADYDTSLSITPNFWSGSYGVYHSKAASPSGVGNWWRMNAPAGADMVYGYTEVNNADGENQWYVVEADVHLAAGQFSGSGVMLRVFRDSDNAFTDFILDFSVDRETSGHPVPNGGRGYSSRTYRFRKLFRNPYSKNAKLQLFALTHHSTLIGSVANATDLYWEKCLVRPATAADLLGIQNEASVTQLAGALASATGRTTAYWQIDTQASSEARAFMSARAESTSAVPMDISWAVRGVADNLRMVRDGNILRFDNVYAGTWNSGAVSNETTSADAYLSFRPVDFSTLTMVGLTVTDPASYAGNYRQLNAAIYLAGPSGVVQIYENGDYIGQYASGASFRPTDTFTIEYVRSTGIITYRQNGRALRTAYFGGNFNWRVGISTIGNTTTGHVRDLVLSNTIPQQFSAVTIGASEFSVFNPSGNAWLKALEVKDGNVLLNGGLQAGAYIRLGSGQGWPVALQPRDFQVGDGDVVSFGTTLDRLPSMNWQKNNLVALNSGETYRLYPENLSTTGFTARLHIITPAAPSNYLLTTSTAPGSGPTRQIDKSAYPDATDGNYTLTFSGTVTLLGSGVGGGIDPY